MATGVWFLQEGLAYTVQIEVGSVYTDTVRAMVEAGVATEALSITPLITMSVT